MVVLEGSGTVDLSGVEAYHTTIALLIVGTITGVEIDTPRLSLIAADNVHHSSHGIGTVQGGCTTLDNFNTTHVVEIQTVVVNVVKGFTGKAFTVHKKEYRITTETLHVERDLLVH